MSDDIKIILADDDQDDRLFFADAVEDLNLNYPVEFFRDGIELLERLADKNRDLPDIVFLDLNMPLLSGFETLQQIRQDSKFRNIPIIAIYSTSSNQDGIKSTFGLGANAYIVKPLAFNDLKLLLKKVIEMYRKEEFKEPQLDSFIISI